jgi:hypothetical protein
MAGRSNGEEVHGRSFCLRCRVQAEMQFDYLVRQIEIY